MNLNSSVTQVLNVPLNESANQARSCWERRKTGRTCISNSIAIAYFHLKRIEQIWAERIYVFFCDRTAVCGNDWLTERLPFNNGRTARRNAWCYLYFDGNSAGEATRSPSKQYGFIELKALRNRRKSTTSCKTIKAVKIIPFHLMNRVEAKEGETESSKTATRQTHHNMKKKLLNSYSYFAP